MKFFLSFLPFVLYFVPTCVGHIQTCLTKTDRFGTISDSVTTRQEYYLKCWKIQVPQNTYVRLEIKQLSLYSSYSCSQTYLKISVIDTNETYTFCHQDNRNWKPVTALRDVSINFSQYSGGYSASSSFSLNYFTEDLLCVQKNHFRCSNHSCIHDSKICDENKDCENGIDEIGCEKGVLAVKGVNVSRESALTWLKNQRSASFSWGKNTHRAVTALYLARAASFSEQDLEEELMAKQLELQTSVALLRNSSDPLSVSDLSMFVNALTVTCHNPKRFYGHNLVQILGERVSIPNSPIPGAYLSLCIANWTLSQSDIGSLLNLLLKRSEYLFHLDVQAVTMLALTCVKKLQGKEFSRAENASDFYNATIEKFMAGQLSDGSFGNVYTTALITQALIVSGQENNKQWNVTHTMQFLMKQLNSSSVDFLSAYLVLPIFTGRTLVDMESVDCTGNFRKHEEGITELTNKLGEKIRAQYSLYVGDQKDVIHTIYLRIPEQSSAYDIMKIAQLADPKYKFLHRDISGHVYVYEIAGITNDPEAGKFWLMYSKNDYNNGTIEHYTESPDKFTVKDEDHLIMWYRTADF